MGKLIRVQYFRYPAFSGKDTGSAPVTCDPLWDRLWYRGTLNYHFEVARGFPGVEIGPRLCEVARCVRSRWSRNDIQRAHFWELTNTVS
jgi:hypothetical protein